MGRVILFFRAIAIATSVLAAAAACGMPGSARAEDTQDFCEDFNDNYWDLDKSSFHAVKLEANTLEKAAIWPKKTDRLVNPDLLDADAGAEYYRYIFVLIHDISKHKWLDDRKHKVGRFIKADPNWKIVIKQSNVFGGANPPPPLTLTEKTFGSNESAQPSTADKKSLLQNLGLVYFATPAVGGNRYLEVSQDTGSPLMLLLYKVATSADGQPLGNYPGSDGRERCLVRLRRLETSGAHEGNEQKADYSSTLKRSIAGRARENLPTKGDIAPSSATTQSRIDALTHGLVWLVAEDYNDGDVHPVAAPCTGFRIARNYIMTAGHCVKDEAAKIDCVSSVARCVIRGWLRKSGGDTRHKSPEYQRLELALRGSETNTSHRKKLDYLILKIPEIVNDSLAGDQRILPLERDAQEAIALAIAQYPNAREFVISYDRHCGTRFDKSTQKDASHMGEEGSNDFLHFCDTAGGSSGAPIFRSDLSEIVGVHIAGWKNNPEEGNVAVKSSLIWKDLEHLKQYGNDAEKIAAAQVLKCQEKLQTQVNNWATANQLCQE